MIGNQTKLLTPTTSIYTCKNNTTVKKRRKSRQLAHQVVGPSFRRHGESFGLLKDADVIAVEAAGRRRWGPRCHPTCRSWGHTEVARPGRTEPGAGVEGLRGI